MNDAMQTMHLKVTNRTKETIKDMYDGVPFIFEAGKSLKIPLDAALHIFGWHPDASLDEVERHTRRRLGWNTAQMMAMKMGDKDPGHELFSKLKFEPVRYKLVELSDEDDDGLNDLSVALAEVGAAQA